MPHFPTSLLRADRVKSKHNFFKNFFFPSTISERNKLDPSLRNSESFLTFKKSILQFINTAANSMYNCHNLKRIKIIGRLHLALSHLRGQKFKHNFQESLCNCGHGIKSINHVFLHRPLFFNERNTFLTLSCINCNLSSNTDLILTQTLLSGNLSFNSNKNLELLNATIDYLLSTKRFDESLFEVILSSYRSHSSLSYFSNMT